MEATFVKKKAYEAIQLSDNNIPPVLPNKVILRVYNHLKYNPEISSPLIVSQLLGLPDQYILFNNFKSINLGFLQYPFPEFANHVY